MTLVLSRPSSTGDEDVVVQRSRLQEHGSPGYLIKQNLRLYSPSADEPCSSSSRAPRASQAAKLGPLIHLQGTKLFVSSSPRPKETMPQLSSVVPALDGRKALSRCTLCLSLRVGHVLPSADPRIVLSSSSSVSRMDDAPETVMKGAKDFRTAQAPSLATRRVRLSCDGAKDTPRVTHRMCCAMKGGRREGVKRGETTGRLVRDHGLYSGVVIEQPGHVDALPVTESLSCCRSTMLC
ncbi:hypothetical protein L226DRAFT_247877 [Lentinus tigrinus ALCF2SS1-7]|uniref:uncharacterized protein n=1 Tax=Lentinus tigrinus ALCF2SS1-7 TaxID=1328758 RepID=UPI0011663F6C|nr:hypothetical protein L226DRAFT_247877 [Lentinus tigrinus ALCF2SS1-7]